MPHRDAPAPGGVTRSEASVTGVHGAPVCAVILAAGLGSRLGCGDAGVPKCLTAIRGTPILVNAIRALARAPIARVVVVVGFLEEEVRAAIGRTHGALRVDYVTNPQYASSGTAESLRLALREIAPNEGLVILEGDVFFEEGILHDLLSADRPAATVVEPYNPQLSGTFVDLDDRGIVEDWVHERDRTPGTSLEGRFKTVNLTWFDSRVTRETLVPAVDRIIAARGPSSALEAVMRHLVRDLRQEITAVPTSGRRWFEVDTVEDLAAAEALFAPEARVGPPRDAASPAG